MVYLITGKAGAGKTTYATKLAEELQIEGYNVVMIDGDVYRDKTENQDFSVKGRVKNLMGAAEEAKQIEKLGKVVILAFIAPKKLWRDLMRDHWQKSRVIYIPGGSLWEGTTYEMPAQSELDLYTNK